MIRYTTNPPSRQIAPRPTLKPSEGLTRRASPLLAAITAYLRRSGMSAAGFGKLATGDREFVSRLREGENLEAEAVDKAKAFLARFGFVWEVAA